MTESNAPSEPAEPRFVESNDPAGGRKLCSRREVNPDISVEEAFDEAAFRALLESAFDNVEETDDGFSVHVRDRESQHTFEAYSGASGPAYGGPRRYFVKTETGHALDPEVHSMLRDFERWLTEETLD
ncbi:hypothetical protein [Halogeometricum limi]|uniref:Uncharacterized protein n=1 Tax=Halogeometricum limi TaxID=555875 RepID=A0A1I6I1R0_9EURY|nr:hypothetical protein [Halogeometricum limi]SFR60635.1 hypothetical protein SAMN04488124_2706 [Halogeometricum limi]